MSIAAVVESVYGPCSLVLHPLHATGPHIDWNVYPPRGDYQYWKIVSDGFSAIDMGPNSPRKELYASRVEVAVVVKTLDLPEFSIGAPWFIEEPRAVLDHLAQNNGWLDDCLVLPNGRPAEPFDDETSLDHLIFLMPMMIGKQGGELNRALEAAARAERILMADYIYGPEWEQLKKLGLKSAFYRWLGENRHMHMIDPGRAPYL
jgi:hypothetical protein